LRDRERQAFVANDVGGEDLGILGTGFQAELPFHVGGNADGSAVEIDTGEGNGFPCVKISHLAADASGLGGSLKGGCHKDKQEDNVLSSHNLNPQISQ